MVPPSAPSPCKPAKSRLPGAEIPSRLLHLNETSYTVNSISAGFSKISLTFDSLDIVVSLSAIWGSATLVGVEKQGYIGNVEISA